MATILLSIKPEYSNRIMSGEKKFEYRKHVPQEPIEKIIVYSTDPEKSVVGEVLVSNVLVMSPSRLWELTKSNAGISQAKYRLYFKGCKKAYAYQLGTIKKYDPPKGLSDFGIVQAPQSFVYVDK